MAELSVIVRTADQTHSSKLELEDAKTGGEVVEAAIMYWKLQADVSYSLVNVTSNKPIHPTRSLAAEGVNNGDTLEVQPVLVAGHGARLP